jgi:hypothetical protein
MKIIFYSEVERLKDLRYVAQHYKHMREQPNYMGMTEAAFRDDRTTATGLAILVMQTKKNKQ